MLHLKKFMSPKIVLAYHYLHFWRIHFELIDDNQRLFLSCPANWPEYKHDDRLDSSRLEAMPMFWVGVVL